MVRFSYSLRSSRAAVLGTARARVDLSLIAYRLVLPEHNLKRALWTCAEVAPLSLLVGVLIHSGRRFLSLSVFLSILSLSTILIGSHFLGFSMSPAVPCRLSAASFLASSRPCRRPSAHKLPGVLHSSRAQTSGGLPSHWRAPVESASRFFLRVSLWS